MTGLVAAGLAGASVLAWTSALRRAVEGRRLRLRAADGGPTVPRTRAGRRVRERRRAEVVELVAAFAAELAAGAAWDAGLLRAAAGVPGELPGRLAQAADIGHALRLAMALPGAEALAAVAAVGGLSERTGAAAADLVDRVGDAIRAEARSRRAVEVELAPALATTRLLAGLPLVGLLMGGALGANPLWVLADTGRGRACLLGAVVLEVLGLLWCRAIRRKAVG